MSLHNRLLLIVGTKAQVFMMQLDGNWEGYLYTYLVHDQGYHTRIAKKSIAQPRGNIM